MCTAVRFTDENGNIYAGRNLDWGVDFGEKVVVTPANWKWQSAHLGEQVTKSPIIGMGIVVNDFPAYFDAANSEGLYCAGLSFAAGFAHYTDAVEGKTNIASFEIPLWVTTNFTTVDEVEKVLENANITGDAVDPHMPPTPMHWFIADKNRAIVVEQDSEYDFRVFHDGFDCLTNQPGFDFHRNNVRNYLNLNNEWPADQQFGDYDASPLGTGPSMMGLPGDQSSISRFVRTAILNKHFPAGKDQHENLIRLFKTLQNASMYKGYCKMEDGNFEYTLYSGGYSQTQQTYYYNTWEEFAIQSVKLSDYADATDLVTVQ